MKITKVKVENFKSLANIDAQGFDKVNFIHGYNNSGKSNFLKFLELLFSKKSITAPEAYIDENGVEQQRSKVVAITPFWNGYIYDTPFLFTKNVRTNSIKFQVLLELDNEEYPHSQELTQAGYLYTDRPITPIKIIGEVVSFNANDSEIRLNEVKIKGITVFTSNAGAPRFFEMPANSALNGREDIFNDIMDAFNDCVTLVESERYFSKEVLKRNPPDLFNTSNFKNWLYGISLNADRFEKFSDLVTFLNKFNLTSKVATTLNKNLSNYPFRETKMTFSKFKDEIEIMLENPIGRFPLKNYGTGIQQIFYILSKLFTTNSKIVLIEELELNLSPEYQELIINNLQTFVADKRITQVFFTSHSDYLNRADFKVYEVSIDENGQSSIKSSSYNGLKALRRALMPFAESDEKGNAEAAKQ